jgi:hypothetical protein
MDIRQTSIHHERDLRLMLILKDKVELIVQMGVDREKNQSVGYWISLGIWFDLAMCLTNLYKIFYFGSAITDNGIDPLRSFFRNMPKTIPSGFFFQAPILAKTWSNSSRSCCWGLLSVQNFVLLLIYNLKFFTTICKRISRRTFVDSACS